MADLSEREACHLLGDTVDGAAHLDSDRWKAFVPASQALVADATAGHSDREYARGPVHAKSVDSFNNCVRRTATGAFHHASPQHADLHLNDIGFAGGG